MLQIPSPQHRKFSWISLIALVIGISLLPTCKKENDKGTNEIEFAEARANGGQIVKMMPFLPGSEVVNISLKNNVTGSAGSVHVKLVHDSFAVSETESYYLRPDKYSIPSMEYDVPAGGTVTIPITITRTGLSADSTYGVGLKISEVSSGTIAADAKSIAVVVDLRNKYDGVFKITGSMIDYAAPTITFTEQNVRLITTSPTTVYMVPIDLGIPGYLILSGGSLSYYGSFGPVFTFNNVDITSVVNWYGQPAANTRSAELDPSGNNEWYSTARSFSVKFWMNQPSVVTTPPHHRTLFNNAFIYQGPRF